MRGRYREVFGGAKIRHVFYGDASVRTLFDRMDLCCEGLREIPDKETQQFEDMITLQDVPIVESQRPELLPLDLQAELHLRSDRTAIAYRKWLRELGLTFGTA